MKSWSYLSPNQNKKSVVNFLTTLFYHYERSINGYRSNLVRLVLFLELAQSFQGYYKCPRRKVALFMVPHLEENVFKCKFRNYQVKRTSLGRL